MLGLLFVLGVRVIPELSASSNPSARFGSSGLDWTMVLGAAALLWGALRRGRPALMLLSVVLVSAMGTLVTQDTPDSLIHLFLLLALGVAAVETGLHCSYCPSSPWGEASHVLHPLPRSGSSDGHRSHVGSPGKALCTLEHSCEPATTNGCVRVWGSTPLSGAGVVEPEDVRSRRGARRALVGGGGCVGAERYLSLRPLLSDAPGFSTVVSAPGWRVFSFESDPRREP